MQLHVTDVQYLCRNIRGPVLLLSVLYPWNQRTTGNIPGQQYYITPELCAAVYMLLIEVPS